MTDLPFSDADPAHQDFQYLEDLSTAYWYSEVLFAALELELFDFIDKGISSLDDLAIAASCRKHELHRLLKTMERLALVREQEGRWFNSQVAGMFLIRGHSSYMGDFLLYRRYMQPRWQSLVQKVSLKKGPGRSVSRDEDYALRTLNYVRATDALLRQKSEEIVGLLGPISWEMPVLDIGGGAGALSRALIRSRIDEDNGNGLGEGLDSVLFDLPEVIEAARKIYKEEIQWNMMQTFEGDFRTCEFDSDKRYGLILLSNFLHAYGHEEARELLVKAAGLLRSGGIILVHDYFPDRRGRSPQKSTLYDLNMMLNTYDGMCHESATVINWLERANLNHTQIRDLSTDTSVIIASTAKLLIEEKIDFHEKTDLRQWVYAALEEGFERAVLLPAGAVVTGPWVRKKCRFGCKKYGNNLQCPPYSMDSHETKEMLESYSLALILEGVPPGRDFHEKLLTIEKKAFLSGFHKAFVFGAGPCPVCKGCPEDNVCRYPELARPSMEASGIDVYETARAAGINLKPVLEKGRYVKYIGLLLLE